MSVRSTSVSALQVDNTSFEEWMKMATDNKINATNTWSFALIDYFHDMSLLRSESGDGSINFQKASCTLDGCVKVWTSRVDSVMAETGRLLSGLQDENESLAQNDVPSAEAAGSDDEADADEDDAPRTARKNRRAREATLAKNFSQLQVKRFDLEFSVDPLFKKTSADFDEGGAGGLLMNHLHLDDTMKVVFDSSDVAGAKDEGAAEPAEDANIPAGETSADANTEAAPEANSATNDAEDDVSMHSESAEQVSPAAFPVDVVRALLLDAAGADLTGIPAEEQLDAVLQSRVLCPSLATFAFASGNDAQLPLLQDLEEEGMGSDLPDLDMAMDTDDQMDQSQELDFFDGPDALGGVGTGEDDRELGVAFVHPSDEQPTAPTSQGDHDILFDYFDNRMKKNWAGPEHWKMSRLNLASAAQRERRAESAAPSEPDRLRRRKEAQTIDFLATDQDKPVQTLFAPSATPASISMTRAARSDTSTHLLPDDQHFNSKRLLRLFLKPKATILLRSRPRAPSVLGGTDDDDAWVASGADGDEGFVPDLFQDGGDLYDDVLPAAALDAPAPELDESDDEGLAFDTLRRVRPEYIEHAKRAKQVDIKLLKDNIWEHLHLPPDAHEVMSFGRVLGELPAVYPKQKLEEISTSFCFICLLHLANEEGLAIAAPGQASDARVVRPDDDDDALGAPTDDSADEDAAHVARLDQLEVWRDAALAA
ncbi:hypothetical protein MBRA1_001954 [Malassezia brasiliensis]|uniref:Condensin complex subunit 2 n=1 Tax=Malassezia brasiliensis TaxID=1821822 RepID=A0AAF0DTT9_9BASI|nr:hypothetical protein MBRA1_001954 [Malassezia brasiliensis]